MEKKEYLVLQKLFKQFDRESTGTLSINSFITILQQYHLSLNQEEIDALYYKYSSNTQNGLMDYDSLINELIGKMNQVRKNIVLQVFLQLDKLNTNTISINDLKVRFNPNRHPDAIGNRKSPNEIQSEWIENIDTFCSYYNIPPENSSFTLQNLFEFYSQISFSIKEDRSFEYLIRNVWNIIKQNGGKRKRLFWV